eukprot:m51a1_g7253 hypothetical protein (250) ;mRNA; f:149853-151432
MANVVEEWYFGIPVVTRAWATACAAVTVACTLRAVSAVDLFLFWPLALRGGQWWRLASNFLFFEQTLSPAFFLRMYTLVQFSASLERQSFHSRVSGFVFLLLLGVLSLLGLHYLVTLYAATYAPPFLGTALEATVTYVWAKRNPHSQVALFGVLHFAAPWLPWVWLLFGLVFYNEIVSDILGIVVGHVYFYLEDVLPLTTGYRLIRVPGFMQAMFDPRPAVPVVDVAGAGVGPGEGDEGVARQQDLHDR